MSIASHTNRPAPAPQAPLDRADRAVIVGGEEVEEPYPLYLKGVVERGFGRGSKELGIPTANLPDSAIGPLISPTTNHFLTGIYLGFARVYPSTPASSSTTTTSTTNESKALTSESISGLPTHTAPYPEQGKKELGEEDYRVWPMVMSVGWNPFYNNEKLTAEVHVMHPFPTDFYGHTISVIVLGYIRPELNFISKDALIADINTDVKVAMTSLARPGWAKWAEDPALTG